jgi:hypothetical protein
MMHQPSRGASIGRGGLGLEDGRGPWTVDGKERSAEWNRDPIPLLCTPPPPPPRARPGSSGQEPGSADRRPRMRRRRYVPVLAEMRTLLFDENKPETRRQAAILWGERADVAATQRRQRRPRCRTSWAVVETVEAEPQRRVRTLPLVSRRLWDIRRPGVAVWRPFGPASDASRQHRCRPSKRN